MLNVNLLPAIRPEAKIGRTQKVLHKHNTSVRKN